jgi:CRP-like cAMP-binding protein
MQPEMFQPISDTMAPLAAARTNCEGKLVGNRILLALPDVEFEIVRPFLIAADPPPHAVLHEPGDKLEFVHFPNRGLVSQIIVTREAKTVAVGMIGNEGLIGVPAVMGMNRALHRAVVQIRAEGFRLRVEALSNLLPSAPKLQLLLSRYAVIQGMQAAQSAACNRLHGIEQRLARWLLTMQDRADGPLLVTHDFLATMLGTDRPSVSLAAGILQRKGAIGYSRGVVHILTRGKIEEVTCECYEIIKQLNRGLLR